MSAATAVFTGAGISGAAPAGLPMGNRLRDELLALMYEQARLVDPSSVRREDVDEVVRSGRKLEVVLGRLWGVIGDEALRCLMALELLVPNEAHMLAALHLARGGRHVTLNFDVGIERAYALLSGQAELLDRAPDELHEALGRWRALAGSPPALAVVASREAFDRWIAAGQPPALLKVHGSLTADQRDLVDVVVVDIEELGLLHPARRAAVDSLAHALRLLITGYAGADPDVYEPLLAAAAETDATWACYSLAPTSPVPHDATARDVELRVGAPEGLATVALRDLLGLSDAPGWPEITVDPVGWEQRFAGWRDRLLVNHDAAEFAHAWAWLLADAGDNDTAASLLSTLLDQRRNPAVEVRLAEVLYTRARGDDRRRAAVLYRRLTLRRRVGWPTRSHALIRLGGIARGRAVRQTGAGAVLDGAAALALPAVVVTVDRLRHEPPEIRASGFGAIQQTSLRLLELAAARLPRSSRPAIAAGLRVSARLGERVAATSPNGNRRALARSHRLLALALADLLTARPPAPEIAAELRSLRDTYRHADDLPGAGNCVAALAVVALADGDQRGAKRLMDEARNLYAAGRPEHAPLPSGAALLDRVAEIAGRRSGRHSAPRCNTM